MRILVSYFFGPSAIPLGESCAAAFASLGHDVCRFNSDPRHPLERVLLKPAGRVTRLFGKPQELIFANSPWLAQNFRHKLLEDAVKQFRPEVLFLIRGNGVDGDFLGYLKKRYGIERTVCWWVKGPKWFELMRSEVKDYDRYYCIHREGYQEGEGIHHLPALAVDNVLYRKMPEAGAPEHPVVFVGGWNRARQQVVQELSEFPLSIYGPKWFKQNLFRPGLRSMVRGKGIWGDELCRLYNRTAVALNISSWNTNVLSGLNLRVLDVVGCGTFLLTDHSEELKAYLVPGEEVETYRDVEELKDKLRFYLHNPEPREKIARRGYQKVRQIGSYRDKMQQVLAEL